MEGGTMTGDPGTSQISDWRSIVTLIVFVLTNVNVLFPFHIPIFVPRKLWTAFLNSSAYLRIISPREVDLQDHQNERAKAFVRFNFPMNSVTAPLLADLFLLAILAIGRKEIHDGILGSDNIFPIDIMAFFLTLAYIAISIDASGLIRYLALKVLQWGGSVGHRLFFYLYCFFFILGGFIGNDPIILSGTAFLAYITRISSNIVHPQAWIYTQFAIANIASAILVSSNPANLVLAGAFSIKFIDYTANMIVPVVFTAIILLPCLLYMVFANDSLIPYSIILHQLPGEVRDQKPINPNIPKARGSIQESDASHGEQQTGLSLEEIMNPFLDKASAAFGTIIMMVTLITVLVLNAVFTGAEPHPVFWVSLPAAFVTFCWDLACGWYHREETRQVARTGRQDLEDIRANQTIQEDNRGESNQDPIAIELVLANARANDVAANGNVIAEADNQTAQTVTVKDKGETIQSSSGIFVSAIQPTIGTLSSGQVEATKQLSQDLASQQARGPTTLASMARDAFRWLQETFPTATAVVAHLPLPLVPFAFSMFILVQALVNKGWVRVFAYGWDHWASKTGTIGAIGGMGFLSVILCNFSGTNIGTTILLSRVIQTWAELHADKAPISNRTFWATVYSMALGVNYGAFSTTFSASLAGLLWRDILSRKHIHVRRREFARVNLPIISISMIVGCLVLIGEVYITRDNTPYSR